MTLATQIADDASVVERWLTEHFLTHGLGRPGQGEVRSWRSSLPALALDLRDAGLGDVEMLIEHRLPLSSKRADAVLAGVHPLTGQPSYVVVELKQWSAARRWKDSESLVDVPGASYRPVLHPSLQVAGYTDYLRGFVSVLGQQPDAIVGAAYLHNATEAAVSDLLRASAVSEARLFTGQRRGQFADFLRSRFAPTSGVASADALLASAVLPSRQLLSVAADEIRDREQFVLLDEQRVAYEMVLQAVRAAREADRKTVVVVSGGPGSGKSVIALSLLGEFAREGRPVLHATGSRSFTQTLRRVAGRGSKSTQSLFKYFNDFMSAEKNSLDVLILDEAHRLRETSVRQYTPRAQRALGRPQVDELLDVARVPVFLLDEHQVVRPGELGSVSEIEQRAAARGLPLVHVDLKGQFRSGGSDAYVAWVLRLLGLDDGGPTAWHDEPGFAVEVAADPEVMESRLQAAIDAGTNARMTAGFCWPWNVRGERAVGEAPPSALWATAPGGFGQIGCVYTAQGFEYAWNGVIFGADLVWRGDRWIARRECSKDPAFRSRKTVDDPTFDRLVRHAYKVLLTRGMIGTVLYSTDPETHSMLTRLVNPE